MVGKMPVVIKPGKVEICYYDFDTQRDICRTIEQYDELLNWIKRFEIYNGVLKKLKPGTYRIYLVVDQCGPSKMWGYICGDSPIKMDEINLNELKPCDFDVLDDGERAYIYLCIDGRLLLDPRILISRD